MDESPNDLDQLFRQAAQNAAGLAHVLDPTKAVERGTKRRRFARRRRGALSGLVVLVAVVVFLVPLPRLHPFGFGPAQQREGSTRADHFEPGRDGLHCDNVARDWDRPAWGRDTGRLPARLVHRGEPRRVVAARDRSVSHWYRYLRRHRPHN